MYKQGIKRFIDFIFSFLILLIICPILIGIFLLLKIDSKGPFFFFQERLGYKGKLFKVFKIRTMIHKSRIPNREIRKGDAEVTRVGYILRRLKIDELPQLINVLKGDMSIVGPRPGLPAQLKDFNEDGRIRLEVRPGLTGLAQINGNIFLSWPERWKYDRKYVESVSFILDLKIILKTFLIVIVGEEKFLNKINA